MFAASLVVSALLKLGAPEASAGALTWSGLSLADRLDLVRGVAGLEIAVVCVMLLGSRRRGLQAACSMSAVLLLAHTVLLLLGVRECGCFGRTEVSGALAWGCAGVGLVSSGGLLWGDRIEYDARRPGRTARTLTAGMVMCAAIAVNLKPTGRSPAEEIAAIVIQKLGRSASVLCVVGSPSCPECEASLAAICADPRLGSTNIAFIVRVGDGRRQGSIAERVLAMEVRRDLWWKLIENAPPGFVLVTPGALPKTLTSWREALER